MSWITAEADENSVVFPSTHIVTCHTAKIYESFRKSLGPLFIPWDPSPRTGQKSGILTSNPTFWPSTADGSNYQKGLATKGSVRTTMSHPKPPYKLNEILQYVR
jgi:hypothetical protein